ncbi:MAG: restriction endonuclease [Nocardia sp.]|uniref:restriction endonuclease n=1 Tax=Nocardia sp. TaxID=1821 RepID=UPI002617B6FF|nr:restriction endonuclease [Nocardia sp.]MCU1644031.1 restriction endonuclease [Nocardia sp.]
MKDDVAWREYQQDAANLLGELGFDVQVEEKFPTLRGARIEVDVTARRMVAGVEILWVVECKLWKDPVPQGVLHSLVTVCEETGADRGFLLCETGFQAGAILEAHRRNITLTSLAYLRCSAAQDLLETRQRRAEARLHELMSLYGPELGNDSAHPAEWILQMFAAALPEQRLSRLREASESTDCGDGEGLVGIVDELVGMPSEQFSEMMTE